MITVQDQPERPGPWWLAARVAGVAWGISGIAAVLAYAATSLQGYALDAVAGGLKPIEGLVLVVNSLFMLWAEGYRGFQRSFSPRVAARALHLYLQPTVPRLILAPLFCAGFFGATVRLRGRIWIGTGLIILAVLVFNQLPQPWRGILDAGVLGGLVWGAASLLVAAWTTFRERRELVPAEVPASGGL